MDSIKFIQNCQIFSQIIYCQIFLVDPWLTEKRVDQKKWRLTEIFLSKTIRFVWNNSYVGACVLVITAWWPNAKFYFLVNWKIWLWIDRKNLQFTVDQRHYWPKVPNILHTYLSIQNVHFLLLWDFLSGTCWKKFPIMSKVLRFHRFLVTKVHNVSRGPVKNVIFPFGQCNICGSDSLNFRTYLCIQNVPLFRTFLDLQNVPL